MPTSEPQQLVRLDLVLWAAAVQIELQQVLTADEETSRLAEAAELLLR